MLKDTNMEEKITKKALSLGFDLVGFSPSELDPKYTQKYEEWLKQNFEADMAYMQKPRISSEKSVIVLAKNYYYDQKPLYPGAGRIARYAYGRDYHKVIGKILKKLVKFLHLNDPTARAYVDTGPVLERAYAEQAGLGFIGKNSCLITKEFGSWVFLAVIFTDLDLAPTHPLQKNLCGNCQKCLDACPTRAIREPGLLNSNLCISYHTIENRNRIPAPISTAIRHTRRIFGCDICQEICPHNIAKQKNGHVPTSRVDTKPLAGDQVSLKTLPKTDSAFLTKYAGSPLMRTKRRGLERNLKA
jgi:epoxyqueuosine reductase